MELIEEIKCLAADCLTNSSQFIVDVTVSSRKSLGKVVVLVDGDEGISIDDCAELSRKLSKHLDEKGWLDNQYLLEVSTPGLDQPLKLTRQYLKNIGRSFKVKLCGKTLEGILQQVTDHGIVLEHSTGSGKKRETHITEVPFTEIEKAFVLVSFK